MKRNLLSAFYKLGGFRPFHWSVRDRLLILMYHRFSATPHGSRVSADDFRKHLRYLRSHMNSVSLEEGLEALSSGRGLPPNPVVITIDDGYRDAYEIALPLVNEFKFNATLFAVTDFIDGERWIWTDLMRFILQQSGKEARTVSTSAGEFHISGGDSFSDADVINGRLKKIPNQLKDTVISEIAEELNVEVPRRPTSDFEALTWNHVVEMDSSSIQIESHTVTHPILTGISDAELDDELVSSKARLEEKLSRTVNYFCYPNGDESRRVREAVSRAGYKAALTTRFGFNSSEYDPFTVNRIYAPSAMSEFAQCASGFESFKQGARRVVRS